MHDRGSTRLTREDDATPKRASDAASDDSGAGGATAPGGPLAVDVVHNVAAHRYEAHVGGELAVAEYTLAPTTITFTHTRVPPALTGRGVAAALAHAALEDARASGRAVVPRCPYFAAYIRRHPEYQPLVTPGTAMEQAP